MQNAHTLETINWYKSTFTDITTHIGSMNVEPQFRTQAGIEQVCSKFLYKLNIAIFGRNGFERYGKHISVLPVVHNREYIDKCHVHFAFGGFPSRLTDEEIMRKCYTVAQHTTGVEFIRKGYLLDERQHWMFNDELLAVDFDNVGNKEAWLNYMFGHITKRQSSLDTVLVQLASI